MTKIRVFQGTATASEDGWANDAYYTLTRSGFAAREGVADATSWEECSGRVDGEEYVTLLTDDGAAPLECLRASGYRAEVSPV